jgi:hypothetical protein
MSSSRNGKDSGPAWLESAGRVGHTAKGIVFASAGTLALWRSLDASASGSGSREAIRAIAGAPPGRALVAVLAVGLAAYVVWRLTQAVLGSDGAGRGRRALYLLSAAIYASLTVFAVRLLAGGAAVGTGAGSRMAEIMARPRGPWFVGAVGAGLVVLGVRVLTRSRAQDPKTLDLAAAVPRWVTSVGRAGVRARGVALLLVGGGLLQAAALRGPVPSTPWLTALFGVCLLVFAAHEWTRARYALPDP